MIYLIPNDVNYVDSSNYLPSNLFVYNSNNIPNQNQNILHLILSFKEEYIIEIFFTLFFYDLFS